MVKQQTKVKTSVSGLSIVPRRIGREIRVVPFLVKIHLFFTAPFPKTRIERGKWDSMTSRAECCVSGSMIDREKTVESAWTKVAARPILLSKL